MIEQMFINVKCFMEVSKHQSLKKMGSICMWWYTLGWGDGERRALEMKIHVLPKGKSRRLHTTFMWSYE